jgi:hypothetical protein
MPWPVHADSRKSKEQRKLMTLRKTSFTICLIISVLCLAAGYGIAGQWIGATAAIMSGPGWLFARKYPASGLPLIFLLASVCLAVAGSLAGSQPLLMICGAGFSLAVWDLLLFNNAMGEKTSREQTHQFENSHLQSLGLALGSGLSVAFLGHWFHFKIPFVLLLLCIALVIFLLDRVWSNIKKTE